MGHIAMSNLKHLLDLLLPTRFAIAPATAFRVQGFDEAASLGAQSHDYIFVYLFKDCLTTSCALSCFLLDVVTHFKPHRGNFHSFTTSQRAEGAEAILR